MMMLEGYIAAKPLLKLSSLHTTLSGANVKCIPFSLCYFPINVYISKLRTGKQDLPGKIHLKPRWLFVNDAGRKGYM